jgi:uncharacterized delta-60 repeat protein/uncharacterized repeat protein (TIGR01451 family)
MKLPRHFWRRRRPGRACRGGWFHAASIFSVESLEPRIVPALTYLTVQPTAFVALGNPDAVGGVGDFDYGDYYIVTTVDNKEVKNTEDDPITGVAFSFTSGQNEDLWTSTTAVDSSSPLHQVEIQVFDQDGALRAGDDVIDISPAFQQTALFFAVDTLTGQWTSEGSTGSSVASYPSTIATGAGAGSSGSDGTVNGQLSFDFRTTIEPLTTDVSFDPINFLALGNPDGPSNVDLGDYYIVVSLDVGQTHLTDGTLLPDQGFQTILDTSDRTITGTGFDFQSGTYDAYWSVGFEIPITSSPILKIEVFDQDGGLRGDDDVIDISPAFQQTALFFSIDPKTGHWTSFGNSGSELVDYPAMYATGDGPDPSDTDGTVNGQLGFTMTSDYAQRYQDTDGDGLPDSWETTGIDYNGDGKVDYVIPGADPTHKDVYVDQDSMLGRAPSPLPGITQVTTGSPIVVTSPHNGLTTGTRVQVQGVVGIPAANGLFTITSLSADTFSLNGTLAASGTYMGGGTWSLADLAGTGLATGTSLDLAINAYANAPVSNPDGTTGISLHVLTNSSLLVDTAWPSNEGVTVGESAVQVAQEDYDALRLAQFGTAADEQTLLGLLAESLVVHYAVFADTVAISSGTSGSVDESTTAESFGASGFAVTLGAYPKSQPSPISPDGYGGEVDQQAAAFMTGLGATLGMPAGQTTAWTDLIFPLAPPGGPSGLKNHFQVYNDGLLLSAPPEPLVSVSDAITVEGNSGTTPANFTVSLSSPYPEAVTVKYMVVAGTASDDDFEASSGVLTFAPGQDHQTLTVNVIGDSRMEPNETFYVLIYSPTNATLYDSLGLGTIVDDDAQAIVSPAGNGLSPSYGVAGVASVGPTAAIGQSDSASGIAVDSNGRTILFGDSTSGVLKVVRLLPNGVLDPTFGAVGIKVTQHGNVEFGYSGSVYMTGPDRDKILIVGTDERVEPVYGAMVNQNIVVARLNVDGTLDTTFNDGSGTGGFVNIDTAPYGGTAQSSATSSNLGYGAAIYTSGPHAGQVVVLGNDDTVGAGGEQLTLSRLNEDGSADSSFGTLRQDLLAHKDYYVSTVAGAGARSRSTGQVIKIGPDGAIYVGGFAGFGTASSNLLYAALMKMNDDGSLAQITYLNVGPFAAATSAYIQNLAFQPDGKIVAVINLDGQHLAIARFNTNLTLDTTFNGTGYFVDTTINGRSFTGVTVQPDGKIVATGYANSGAGLLSMVSLLSMRFNSDGSLDASYSPDGSGLLLTSHPPDASGFSGFGPAVGDDQGDTIVSGGEKLIQTGTVGFVTAKYTPARADISASISGSGSTIQAGETYIYTVSIRDAGDIAQFPSWTLALPAGLSVVSIDGDSRWVYQTPAANQTGGTIVAAARSMAASDGTLVFEVVVHVDGNLPFHTSLSVTLTASSSILDPIAVNNVSTMATPVSPLVVSVGNASFPEGNSGVSYALFPVTLNLPSWQTVTVRYATTSGGTATAADYSPTSGVITFAPGETQKMISVPVYGNTTPQEDRTYLVNLLAPTDATPMNATIESNAGVGTIIDDDPGGVFTPTGPMDLTFNGTGTETQNLPGPVTGVGVAVDASDRIIAGGAPVNAQGHTSGFAIARFNPNGTLDTTFNGTGLIVLNPMVSGLSVSLSAVDAYRQGPDIDKVIALGGGLLYRFNVDGSPDTTFGSGGVVSLGALAFSTADADAIYSAGADAGKIVVTAANEILRYNADGTLDMSFNGTGMQALLINGHGVDIDCVTTTPDGKIVVAGDGVPTLSTHSLFVARFNADGTLDTTFGTAGSTTFPVSAIGYAVTVDSLGRVVVAGQQLTDSSGLVVRFTTSGALDTSFNAKGYATDKILQGNSPIPLKYVGVAIDADGQIAVVASNASTVARYNTDGTNDTTFNPTNGINPNKLTTGPNTYHPASLTLTSTGDVVVNGTITTTTATDSQMFVQKIESRRADLSVSATISSTTPQAGQQVVYTYAVTNSGDSADYVSLSDLIQSGLTFVSATAPLGWTITAPSVGNPGNIVANLRSLAPTDGVQTIVITLQVGSVKKGTTIANTATVASTTVDPSASNNSATKSATVADNPPVATVSLNPTSPRPTSLVTATVSASDVDGDTIKFTYVWKINNVVKQTHSLVASTTDTFNLALFGTVQVGDVVSVEVTPNDGTLIGAVALASGTVAVNHPPTTTVALSTSSPTLNSNLVVTATPADPEGDPVSLTYTWSLDGIVVQVDGPTTRPTDGFFVRRGHGDQGSVITVSVTPNDGSVNGAPATASATVIDRAPTAAVSLDTSDPSTTSTATATVTAADVDGDPLSFTYVWKINGQIVQTHAGLTSTTDAFDLAVSGPRQIGDVVSVEVTANDGFQNGNLASADALIADTSPASMPPTVANLPASILSVSGGTLNATINPNGTSTSAYFAYSTDPSFTPTVVTTLAGSEYQPGFVDGTGPSARFRAPYGVVTDAAGNIYISDSENETIRKIAPGGAVVTFAGSISQTGSADARGTLARFSSPMGLAIDGAGDLYVADAGNATIRKITPDGVVSTIAGTPLHRGSNDGVGANALFNDPVALVVDGAGNLYVADEGNDNIRKIVLATGQVSTLAGVAGIADHVDGSGAMARFEGPQGITINAAGTMLFVTDQTTIRSVTLGGVVATIAGTPKQHGSNDGNGSVAEFGDPVGIVADAVGNLYVADDANQTIRKITSDGNVTTIAGRAGYSESEDGTGSDARLANPEGLAIDSAGNLYTAEIETDVIAKISPDTVSAATGLTGSTAVSVSTALTGFARGTTIYEKLVASNGKSVVVGQTLSFTTLSPAAPSVSTGPATITGTTAQLSATVNPNGVTSNAGFQYSTDPSLPQTDVTVVAGQTTQGYSDGAGSAAVFNFPQGVAIDLSGNLFVADLDNRAIRKIAPDGTVTTLAGASAGFYDPWGIATDQQGNVYVTDEVWNDIRKITPGGTVTTLAGDPAQLITGSANGVGPNARFNGPKALAVDASGNVYVADTENDTIRKITPDGTVTTLAGSPGVVGSSDGVGGQATFDRPFGIAVDPSGIVYVADTENDTIRKILPDGTVTTLAGLAGSYGSSNGAGSAARFAEPAAIAIDANGDLYVSQYDSIRKVAPDGVVSTVGPALGGGSEGLSSIAVDGQGNLYGAGSGYDSRIYSITTPTMAGPSNLTGTSPIDIQASLTDLLPGTTYYYRGIAASDGGGSVGSIESFLTALPVADLFTTVQLNTSAPATNDTVVAVATKSHANGDEISLTFAWYVNQTLVQTDVQATALTDSFDLGQPGHGDRDDTITVVVTASSGQNTGEPAGATAVVVDSAPVATADLAPSPATLEAGILTATATTSDADGDFVSLTFDWYVSGSLIQSTLTDESSPTDTFDLIKYGVALGDVITVIVTPADDEQSGEAVSVSSTVMSSLSITGLSADGPVVYGQAITVTVAASGGDPSSYAYSFDVTDAHGTLVASTGSLASNQASFSLGAGTYSALVSVADSQGGFSQQQISLTVGKRTLVVTAVDQDMGHSDPVPIPTARITGFVNGDPGSVVSGVPALTTSATSASAAARYPIAVDVTGLAAANYQFIAANGTLTVHPEIKDIRVLWGSESMSILGLTRDLPFSTINRLEVIFTDPVDITGTGLTLTDQTGQTYVLHKPSNTIDLSDGTWLLDNALGTVQAPDPQNRYGRTFLLALDANIAAHGDASISLFKDIPHRNTPFGFSVLPGDYNGDGLVASNDVTKIILGSAANALYDVWADLNGDGKVDSADAVNARSKNGWKFG